MFEYNHHCAPRKSEQTSRYYLGVNIDAAAVLLMSGSDAVTYRMVPFRGSKILLVSRIAPVKLGRQRKESSRLHVNLYSSF